MKTWQKYPVIYEINTWVWLIPIPARHGTVKGSKWLVRDFTSISLREDTISSA